MWSFLITPMWKRVDWILIAAVGVTVGASIVVAYVLILASSSVKQIRASSPMLTGGVAVPTPSTATDEPSLEEGAEIHAQTESSVAVAQTDNTAVDELLPKTQSPQAAPFADHRYDGVISPGAISNIRSSLQLSPDQELRWRALAAAFGDAGREQKAQIDAGQRLTSEFNKQILAKVIPSAIPLVQSLRDDQLNAAGRLARVLGFKDASAMAQAARATASGEPFVAKPRAEPRVTVTPALPPISKAPVLSDSRYDGLLTAAEINRIKLSLKLTSEQESYWPPVAAILRELGQQQMAQVDAGQKLDYSMSGGMAQRFYSAASPLLETLTEAQKSEVRRRARMMGLEAYASYL